MSYSFQPNQTIREVEKQMIQATLKFFNGDKNKAAESLGITARTILNKLTQYEKEKDDIQDS